jgi:predicted metalloendopeptidase
MENVKPSNDFFRYVNGTLDNTAIPADRTVGEVLMNCVKEQMLMRLLF